ncbi:hypothetical protein [Modestobacter italicus]|uniref:hypothetical protein n=1 Tax=Modestobacter italicus (strain DSM 44449 / CECT 9708 / BC 501) TaxID=2732864 RepID=UPI001C97ABD2|nr:hypothetical protein [Modestobacter italicus]
MSQPDSGEYSVRSLAEILREHGLESELGTRPGRRRKTGEDPSVTGRNARVPTTGRNARVDTGRADPAPQAPRAAPRAPGGAARGPAATPAPGRSQPVWTPAPEPAWRPAAGLASPDAPPRTPTPPRAPAAAPQPAPAGPGPLSGTGPVGSRGDAAPPPVVPARRKSDNDPASALYGQGPSTSAIPAGSPSTGSSSAAAPRATPQSKAAEAAARARQAAEHPVTGPIPVVTAQAAAGTAEPEPLTGRDGVLAWARFVGELVVALAVGVGVYFLFTVLWELVPYGALVAAPLTITGLIAGVAAWRKRQGQGPLGVQLLAVLLLAATVLVIAPAAGLLAAG